jgi:cytoskeleton protein RodZ
METPGNKLRDAREARGLSLDDVAHVTRIPRSSLALIEEGRFDRLPAPVFVRGFLKSYARAVGLDPALVVRMHDLGTSEPSDDGDAAVATRARTVRPVRTASSHGAPAFLRGGYALLGAVVVGLLIAAWALVGDRKQIPETSAQGATASPILHERIDGLEGLGTEAPIRLR